VPRAPGVIDLDAQPVSAFPRSRAVDDHGHRYSSTSGRSATNVMRATRLATSEDAVENAIIKGSRISRSKWLYLGPMTMKPTTNQDGPQDHQREIEATHEHDQLPQHQQARFLATVAVIAAHTATGANSIT